MNKPTNTVDSQLTQADSDQPANNIPVKHKKPLKPATRKQKELARIVATEPTTTQREAYRRAYGNTSMSDMAVDTEAYRTLKKPPVQLELAKYSAEAENTVVEVMSYSKEYGKQGGHVGAAYAGVAVSAARDVLDRVHGKAVQRQQIESKAVTINIDLTGVAGTENK